MADYRQIHTHIWKDEWFLDLSPQEKLLFIYLFSNSSTNLVGMYKLALRIIEFETGLPIEFVKQTLDKFSQAEKVIFEDGYILVVNMQKYNANSSPKVTARIQYELSEIPDIPLKIRYFSSRIPYRYPIDTLSTLTEQNITKQDTTEQNRNNHRSSASTASAIANFYDIDARLCEQICQDITGQPTIPPDQRDEVIELLKFIVPQYEDKRKIHDDGLGHFTRWCNTRGKNGRYYSRTNYGWVSWWYESIAPIPEKPEQIQSEYTGALCGTGQKLKRKAEDLGDRDHEQAVIEFRKHIDTCRICGGKDIKSNPMPDDAKRNLQKLLKGKVINNET